MPKKKRVTMEDISKDLGVSKGLVSLALSNKYGVNNEVRSRIILRAAEMNYDFTSIRRKRSNKSESVAVVISLGELHDDSFWTNIVIGVECGINQRNKKLALLAIRENKFSDDADVVKSILEINPCGVVVFSELSNKTIEKLCLLHIPVVVIDSRKYNRMEYTHIRVNNYAGAYRVAEYLYEMGHRDVCFLGDVSYAYSFRERYYGFRDGIEQYEGTSCEAIVSKNAAAAGRGKMIMNIEEFEKRLLSPCRCFTAVMCANDPIAFKVYELCHKHNISIPKDLSVVGFDGTEQCNLVFPHLTSVEIPKEKMGEYAVEILFDHGDSLQTDPKTILFKTNLVLRDSVAVRQSAE